jgi:hypothetical protein
MEPPKGTRTYPRSTKRNDFLLSWLMWDGGWTAGRHGSEFWQWSGLLKEVFTDADTFKLEINDRTLGKDVAHIMLAAAFAIDLDFFESG